MDRYEAKAFVMETHEILTKAANGTLTEEEEDRVLALEATAARMINNKKYLSEFRIIRDDGAGPSDDPKAVSFNTFNDVEEFEIHDLDKIIEFPGGILKKIPYKRYTAKGKRYEVQEKNPDGSPKVTEAGHPVMRTTNDSVSSGPEGFIERDGEYKPFGAASALVARLLEVKGFA